MTPADELISERLRLVEERLAELLAEVRAAKPGGGPALLDRRAAAAACGVTPRVFDSMRHRGELPGPVRGAGRPRWRRADIERAVERKFTRKP